MNNNTTVSPAEYFAEVKSRKQVMTEAGLSKLYENCLTLLDEYQRSGQIAAQKKLLFHIDNITREKKLLDVGIDTFVYKSDIDDFIHMVDNKVVKIVELENYQRRIPPEIIARIEKCKGIFDKMYVVFTDYTHREERRVEAVKREKDPILFGTFQDAATRTIVERFYFIGDWVDLKAKYIVFDFNGMKGSILTMSMFVVLDFVWTKIKEDRKKRKAVFIDECWKLIGTDSNEMAAEDVVEIFRTIRAYGGSAFAMTQDISQFYEYKGGKYGKAIIGNADTKIIMHLIPSEAQALQAAIQLTDAEMENVSSLQRGQGLVCSSSAKLFVDFVAADYEKQEITTDAKSFYMQEKALKEKQHQEEQARLEVEDKKEPAKTDDNSEKR